MAHGRDMLRSFAIAGALALSAIAAPRAQDTSIELRTNESDIIAATHPGTLAIDDIAAVFTFVVSRLPQRVQVYPSENYYYFRFIRGGVRYEGNIRLGAADRDRGEVSFSYNERITDWNDKARGHYGMLGKAQGVTVEKVEPLLYRVAIGDKSVIFALNDLSAVKPPEGFLSADEKFIGPSFDESGFRFFLVFNTRLKVFHFLLDESAKRPDDLEPAAASDRILIGKRTGFAFYQWGERKVLIGVSARQSHQNTPFDGPFDQLPENFIEGETLRDAIIAADPGAKGRIDRLGMYRNGLSRYLIHPYLPYERVGDLTAFHRCATSKSVAAADRARCFVVDDEEAQRPNPRPLALKRR